MSPAIAPASSAVSAAPRQYLGHPAGLWTLFFTEMWERFSYYGMRALLVLFMIDQVGHGGLGFDETTATAIYGLYTAGVYLACLPGGWIADRLLGQQRSVWWGGVVIMLGHFTLALPGFLPSLPSVGIFYLGLGLIVAGTGLLKPNISAIVGRLYPDGGARRDAGFSLFYMGINLGATIGPLVCSSLGEKVNWHLGFGAAGIGMFLGLVQFRLTRANLGDAGRAPVMDPDPAQARADRRRALGWLLAGAATVFVLILVLATGVLQLDAVRLAGLAGLFIVTLAALFFAGLFAFGGLSPEERRHVAVIAVFFVGSAIFWAGFEQAGSTLNLFAFQYTDRSWFGSVYADGQHPAGYYQSVNPFFIITLAPVFAALWLRLAARHLEPSAPLKFAWGLLSLGIGFGIMALASLKVLHSGSKVLPTWLVFTYFFHTCGELCLSPIGLSWVTKLAPARHVGQLMGFWFTATSLGNLLAGLIAGYVSAKSVEQMPSRFGLMVAVTVGMGLVLAALSPLLRRLIGSVR